MVLDALTAGRAVRRTSSSASTCLRSWLYILMSWSGCRIRSGRCSASSTTSASRTCASGGASCRSRPAARLLPDGRRSSRLIVARPDLRRRARPAPLAKRRRADALHAGRTEARPRRTGLFGYRRADDRADARGRRGQLRGRSGASAGSSPTRSRSSRSSSRELKRARGRCSRTTLVAAEQAATDAQEQAKREAELIVAEAHQEARSITRTALRPSASGCSPRRGASRRCCAPRSASSRRRAARPLEASADERARRRADEHVAEAPQRHARVPSLGRRRRRALGRVAAAGDRPELDGRAAPAPSGRVGGRAAAERQAAAAAAAARASRSEVAGQARARRETSPGA